MTASPGVLSVCLDDSPRLGGLSRGIRDMSLALGGTIVSLDSGRLPPSLDDDAAALTRIGTGRGPLVASHLRIAHRTATILDGLICGSRLVVCHSLFRSHLPFVRRCCLRHRIPYWIVTHGMLDPWVLRRRPLSKRAWLLLWGRRCLRDAAAVICSTEAEMRKAAPAYTGPNVRVVPWPVDLPDVTDREASRDALRTDMRLPRTARVLLWIGRYDDLKRPWHVAAAFRRSAPPDWHLVMHGHDGSTTHLAVRNAVDPGDGRIHVLGPIDGSAKQRILMAADGFVSLSWRENFGYSLADAAAAGLPLVTAPDHDLMEDLPLPCRTWTAPDHSLASAIAVLTRFCNDASHDARGEAGRIGRLWIAAHATRSGFRDALAALPGHATAALPGTLHPATR